MASNASGIAAEVRVDRGSLVHKGDVIVQIDPTDAKNKLAEGLAMLEELKARLGLTDDMTDFNPEDEPEVRLAKGRGPRRRAISNAPRTYNQEGHIAEAFDQTQDRATSWPASAYRQAFFQIRQAYQVCRTGRDQAGDPQESGGRHDDPRPVRRLGGRETGGRRRADFLRHAGHEGRHAGADRPAAAAR